MSVRRFRRELCVLLYAGEGPMMRVVIEKTVRGRDRASPSPLKNRMSEVTVMRAAESLFVCSRELARQSKCRMEGSNRNWVHLPISGNVAAGAGIFFQSGRRCFPSESESKCPL